MWMNPPSPDVLLWSDCPCIRTVWLAGRFSKKATFIGNGGASPGNCLWLFVVGEPTNIFEETILHIALVVFDKATQYRIQRARASTKFGLLHPLQESFVSGDPLVSTAAWIHLLRVCSNLR